MFICAPTHATGQVWRSKASPGVCCLFTPHEPYVWNSDYWGWQQMPLPTVMMPRSVGARGLQVDLRNSQEYRTAQNIQSLGGSGGMFCFLRHGVPETGLELTNLPHPP